MTPSRLEQLVQQLAAADDAFSEIGEDIDAVLLPEGQSYLLRAAQQALVQSEARANAQASFLEALITSLPEGVEYLDVEGRVLFSNRAPAGESPIGADWLSLVGPESRAELAQVLARAASQIEATVHESPVEVPGAEPRWLSRRFSPVRRDDEVVGIVIVTRDITAERAAKAQLMAVDRMVSVGTLAAGVAHEINNPLAAVIANLDMLAECATRLPAQPDDPDDLHSLIGEAHTAADRVRRIVRDLKVLSRNEEDVRTAVDVEALLDSTLRMARNEIRHHATVVREYGGVPRVDGNDGRLGQVFLNLIVNAAQAIPEGNASAKTIRISTELDPRGLVCVSIADDGPGIPLEIQARIFTPFFTTKPVGFGVGLGLAICQRIITALGGEIGFESTPGAGTTFRVYLPVARSSRVTRSPVVPAIAARRRGRILLIDDDVMLATALTRTLSADHETVMVESGARALELVDRGEHYDVIVCDLMMPEMTGMQFYQALYARDPGAAMRTVFMTGGAFTAGARAFFETVPNERIEKPFSTRALRQLVNQLVK